MISKNKTFISQRNALALERAGLLSRATRNSCNHTKDNKRQISIDLLPIKSHGACWEIKREACDFDMYADPVPTQPPNTVTIPDALGAYAYEYIGFTKETAARLWGQYRIVAAEAEQLFAEGELEEMPFIANALDHMREVVDECKGQRSVAYQEVRKDDASWCTFSRDHRNRVVQREREARNFHVTTLQRMGIKPAIIEIILDEDYMLEFQHRSLHDWAYDIVVMRWEYLLQMDEFARAAVEDLERSLRRIHEEMFENDVEKWRTE